MAFQVTDPTTGRTVGLEGDSPPTEEELNSIFTTLNKQDAEKRSVEEPEKTVEDVGVLGQIFAEPSVAGTRELIRKGGAVGKIAGSIPAGLGSNLLAATGALGERNRKIVTEAFIDPSKSETFQVEAIKKEHSKIADRASKRIGLFSPNKPYGKLRLFTELAFSGNRASTMGMAQDMWTNPIDWLASIGDIARAGRAIKGTLSASRAHGAIKKVANLYRKATGRTAKGITRGSDLVHDNNKIAVGLEAIHDTASSQGKTINTAEDGLELVGETKRSVLKEFTAQRAAAQEGGAVVDLRHVADDVIKSQNSQAASLVNKNIQKAAFDIGDEFYGTGKVSLDTADEMVRTLNAQRPTTLGGSINDVSKAALNETVAASIRRELNQSILSATDREYKPLKELYGSLIEIDNDLAKTVLKAGKQHNNSLIRQLSESIDNVPLIYGVLSGNIPLAGAAASTEGWKGSY